MKKEIKMTDTMYTAKCIVCSETVWWDRDSALPAACNQHTYIEVYEAAEPIAAGDGAKGCGCIDDPDIVGWKFCPYCSKAAAPRLNSSLGGCYVNRN